MKIIVTGSLGNVARPLVQQLVSEGHELTVISSHADRKHEIENLGARAAIGSISDVSFLTETFRGADSAFLMTPPMPGTQNIIENTINTGKSYAEAISAAHVPRIVMLSSVGADSPVDNGPIAGLHHIENTYRELNTSAAFLRAGYFYINLFNDIPMIKNAGIIGGNYPAAVKIPLVHPTDIAKAAAEELVRTSPDQAVRYVVSDYREAGDFAAVLGSSIGTPSLPWIEFTDKEAFEGMLQAGLPEEMAKLYEEMGRGIRNGVVQKDFIQYGAPVSGGIRLEDFAREFAERFNK